MYPATSALRRPPRAVLILSVLLALVSPVFTAASAKAATNRYEAESATVSQGLVEANHTGFSGTGFVNGDNLAGSYTEWAVNVPSAGSATLVLRYANGVAVNRSADVSVNGTVVSAGRAFNGTGNWDTWATSTLTASLNAGSNRIRISATTDNGNPNLDYLDVVAADAPASDYQAEAATLSQATVATNHTGFTGSGFVDYVNAPGGSIEWTVNVASAGAHTLTFRYANGTPAPRPMDISVNGTVSAAGKAFPATANWDTWADATVAVTLKAGVNTIRATGTDALGGPNVDRLAVSGSSGSDGQAPTVPASPRVTGTSASSISLAWNDSTDNVAVTGYRVYEGTALKAGPATASATVSGLAASSTHSYTISAVDAAGNESARSAVVTGTTSGAGGGVTADQLLAKVTTCSQISNGKYKTDSDVGSATVAVCNKTGAVFWKADMDIDCDGVRTTQCNEDTDCCFLPETACETSGGAALNAAQLPYVVVPSSSGIWNYTTKGIGCGTVVAMIYNGQIEYAVVGDTGPSEIIGEASYRAAADLGINPDPSNGGIDTGVTYIVFTGSGTKIATEENHSQAVTLGQQLAQQFVDNN
ncbi:CBM35 domain-containing protein [Streptosporangium sp. 'caverna']|uniref:CBM35 domain-containing protein n=1 Tax=Streptosporangium sp. 'caverna' TaxID=2202249 RepID=UPI0013A68F4E|nr:CBM35 domain-containing protein [Streptosporangium sp. 'caverna']